MRGRFVKAVAQNVRMSPSPSGLPQRVISLATKMFARETGFSGPQLHELFAEYTDELGPYAGWGGGSPSRWQIFHDGLKHLSRADQYRLLLDLVENAESHQMNHGLPSADDSAKLRGLLTDRGVLKEYVPPEGLPDDWTLVQKSWTSSLGKVDLEPEAAITLARSTLESVCKHICDERGVAYRDDGDLTRLYKEAAKALNVSPDQHSEQIIKQILSGCVTVVIGMSGLRNALSDAHGKGKRAVAPGPRHARFAVTMAFGVAQFLVDTHLAKSTEQTEAS